MELSSCIGDIATSREVLASQTAASLSEQLEVVDKGPLGPRNSTGDCIEFMAEPYQNKRPHPPVYPLEQTQLISTELEELLQKGAIVEVVNPQGWFYSVLFLVPKKDGGQRPVINLKALNQFVQAQHFKMEGVHSVKEILKPGDWLAKVDLKDAFFTIPIHVAHRKYLWFTFQGKVYEFNCLPFGLSSAPWVYTNTLKPVIALLRELGVWLIAYIDDILILAESREELLPLQLPSLSRHL